MNPDVALDQLAEENGIVGSFHDLSGAEKPTPPETKLALLRANGLMIDSPAMAAEALKYLRAKRSSRYLPEEQVWDNHQNLNLQIPQGKEWRIELEEDGEIFAQGRSDGRVCLQAPPMGVHSLVVSDGPSRQQTRLIVAPATTPRILQALGNDGDGERLWGINAALYGLHSQQTLGIGSYRDLGLAAKNCARMGADFLGVNPVHATGWNSPEVTSPYSPSHRAFLSSVHIDASQVQPCSQETRRRIADWYSQRPVGGPTVDYDGYAARQRPLLEALFSDFVASADVQQRDSFKDYCRQGGEALWRFVQYESLADLHGSDWNHWPPEIRHQRSGNSFPCGDCIDTRHHFHAWLQWVAHEQLTKAQLDASEAGMALGLYLDLAVGSRRNGAEAWCEYESIASGVSIGAPPDHLSPAGQNWDLAALAPAKLADNGYRAFRTVLRQTMQHCGMIRIDHVLGLNRSYWIPEDGSPGGYINQPFDTLLALVCLEANRTNTVVVGEDLGLVPPGFRERLRRRGLYSYSVLQYEKDEQGRFASPDRLDAESLVCFGTHDTPTLAGYCEGREIDWWRKLGWIDDAQANHARHQRKSEVEQLFGLNRESSSGDDRSFPALRRIVYDGLACSDAAMVSVQLDDISAEVEAQNLPGTTDEHPNWQRRYSESIEELASDENLVELGQLMAANGRGRSPLQQREETT